MGNRRSLAVFLFLAFLQWTYVVALTPAKAETATSFFAGKTVRIMVGYPPGGSHDLEARVIARHISRYIPGSPSIIVQNMPGAGGQIQLSHIYNVAKADGLTWAITGRSQMAAQMLRTSVKYDQRKMPKMYGAQDVAVMIARKSLGIKKASDVFNVDPSKIVIGGRTVDGAATLAGRLSMEILGMKGYKTVVGYAGSSKLALAFASNEINWHNSSLSATRGGAFGDLVERGDAIRVWQSGRLTPGGKVVRSPEIDLPILEEVYREKYGRAPSGIALEAYNLVNAGLSSIIRTLVLRPGVPEDRVKIFRDAFARMFKDKAFVTDWERVLRVKMDMISGADAHKIMMQLLTPSPVQEFIKDMIRKSSG